MGQTTTLAIKIGVDAGTVKPNLDKVQAEFRGTTAAIAKSYSETQGKMAELARTAKAGVGGAALAKDLDQARTQAGKLRVELSQQQQELRNVRGSMATTGAATTNMAAQQVTLGKELAATSSRYRELRQQTHDWRQELASVKTGLLETAAVATPTILAIGQAIRFESAMAGVKKVVDTTPAGFARLRSELLGLTRELPMTARELAQIAAAGGQLGIPTEEINAFVKVTTKMAVAFDMTAQEAGDSIGKIKNVYRLAIGEVEGLGDTINRLGNTSAAREKDIVEVMLRVGGTAKQFGLADEATAALAASLLSLGKAPEVASTSINAMLNRMQTATMQSGEFQTALAKIGMSAEEMAAQVAADPQKALDNLLETLSKLSGQERAEVLTGLFGREFQDDIGVLVGSLQTYRDAMGQVADRASYAGSMNKEFEERAKTTENQLQLMKNATVEAAINLGTTFLPAVRMIIAPITTVIRLLADMAAAAPELTAALVSIGTGALVFGQIVKLAGLAKVAMVTMAGESIAAMGSVPGVVGQISGALTALTVGWQIGTWLSQFDIVKKAGVALAHTLTMGWLKVREAWEWMTGGDTDQVRREMEIARQTYAAMIAEIDSKAKQSSNAQTQEQKKVTESARQSAAQQQQATGDALKAMQDQYKAYADQVKSLQEDITNRQRSLASELREMGRSGMTNAEAWQDQKKEADEYFASAQKAAAEGRAAIEAGDQATAALKFAEAKRLADEAKSAYKQLNTEVTDGDQVLIGRNEALKTAMAGVQQAGELAIDTLTRQRDAVAGTMDNLISKSGFADLSKGMDEASQAWMNNWKTMQGQSMAAIEAVEEQIVQMVTPERTVWVNVRTRDLAASKAEDNTPAGYRWGGIVQALATGGGVRNILGGGHLPGWGGGDTVPLMGEKGEYMFDKYRVADAGLPVVQAFHRGRYDIVIAELSKRLKTRIGFHLGGLIGNMPTFSVQHLATGGPVGGSGTTSSAPSKVVEVRFAGGAVQGDERSVEMLLRHLETAGLSA